VNAAAEQVQHDLAPAPVEGELIVKNEVLENARTAVTVIDSLAAGMAALRTEYTGKIYDVATTKGDEEARKARLALRQVRSNLEAARKKGKRLLIDLGKDIDTRAESTDADLLALIDPIDAQIKAEEQRKEDAKAAKVKAEQERVDGLRARIAAISAIPATLVGVTSAAVQEAIDALAADPVTAEAFADWLPQAQHAHAAALAQLQDLHKARADFEAEQVLQQQRAEQQKREAEEAAERQRVEDARLAKQREEQEAREKELADQQAAIDKARREQEEREQAERDRQAAEQRQREETARLEREALEKLRAEQAAEQAFAEVRSTIASLLLRGLSCTSVDDAQGVVEDLDKLDVAAFDLGTWEQGAVELLVDTRAKVRQRIVQLDNEAIAKLDMQRQMDALRNPPPAPAVEPPPPVSTQPDAEQLTVAPSDEGESSASAGPSGLNTAHLETSGAGSTHEQDEEPYPGDEEIEAAVAFAHSVSSLTARIWLSKYVASHTVGAE
jgi:hypothetical protein